MTAANSRLHGLYGISSDSIQPERMLQQIEAALRGGMRILQLRNKQLVTPAIEQQARAMAQLCRDYDALFIVNDDVQLANKVHADGVHLGKDDEQLAAAREALGTKAIIGVSCYNQLSLARQAASQGADYVAFGRFFASQTKPDTVQARLSLLTQAKQQLDIPIVAIGGITADNGAQLVQHGADALAVINALFDVPDSENAARELAALF
jgi:thiamine-phosphate pyrophosphorylase